jgi:hypothetical protein
MKVTPNHPYTLLKKYVKPVIPGKLILSKEEQHNNWGIIVEGDRANQIVQIKPFSKISVDGSDDLFLVKEEDILAFIQE